MISLQISMKTYTVQNVTFAGSRSLVHMISRIRESFFLPKSPFFLCGVNFVTMLFDEHGCLKCPCGSKTFDMVTETRASDITMDKDGCPEDYAIETERAVSIICARCGARIINDKNNILRKRERHS